MIVYLINGGAVCTNVGVTGVRDLSRGWIDGEQTWGHIVSNNTVGNGVEWSLPGDRKQVSLYTQCTNKYQVHASTMYIVLTNYLLTAA